MKSNSSPSRARAVRLWVAVAAWTLISLHLAHASAGIEDAPTGEARTLRKRVPKPIDVKVRAVYPFSRFQIHFSSGLRDTFKYGGSLEVDIRELGAVELGKEILFVRSASGGHPNYTAFVRGGLMPIIADSRGGADQGSALQLGGLLGYNLTSLPSSHDGIWSVATLHCASISGALDWTHWYARHFGLCARLLLESSLPIYGRERDDWDVPFDALLAVGLSLGLAF